jgi:glycosyltransferase EpsF
MRIIQIVENLDKGAVENWIVNVFLESRKTRPDWKWTFYCILGREGRLDKVVREAGGEIIYSPVWINKKILFLKYLRRILKKGKYDVLHAHHDYLSGFYLVATVGLSFKKKILHVHNTDKSIPVGNPQVQKILRGPLRWLAIRFTDCIVSISKDTQAEFFDGINPRKKTTEVLYYGIDLSRFGVNNRERGWLKKELALPVAAKIILFAGRMNELKNPSFVVEILKVLCQTDKHIYALFVGKGGEEETVRRKAKEYGLEENTRLLGWRNDIADIMKEADVFVFPRIEYPREGLGLVVVEAQSAGLPMVLSNGIVEDAIVIHELACFLPLRNNVEEWAVAIKGLIMKGKPLHRDEALGRMEKSHFSLPNAARNLIALYEKP